MSEIKETFLLEIIKMTDEEIIEFISWCRATFPAANKIALRRRLS